MNEHAVRQERDGERGGGGRRRRKRQHAKGKPTTRGRGNAESELSRRDAGLTGRTVSPT